MKRIFIAGVVALLSILGNGSCRQLAVCDGEPGSCLLLRVNGEGSYTMLRSIATLRSGVPTIMRTGSSLGPATLPALLKIVPPTDVAAGDIAQLRIEGLDSNGVSQASGELSPQWDTGSHIEREVTVTLDPVITMVSPPTGPSMGDVPLVITGRGFDPAAQVTVAGQPLGTVQRVSVSELRGTLPQAADRLNRVPLIVRNPDGKTATRDFSYFASTLDFAAMRGYPTKDYDDRKQFAYSAGEPPGAVQPMAAGDFDGDGNQDIAAVNWHNVSQSVSFLWGDGKGGFPARTDVNLTQGAALVNLKRPIAISVIKNPTRQQADFLIAFYDSRKFARIPGAPSRQMPMMLGSAQVLNSGNPNPISFAIANIDSTPDPEVILTEYGSGGIAMFKYDASGDLAFLTNAQKTGQPTQALVMDFTKDGVNDVLLVDRMRGEIAPFVNNGSGVFANGTPWPVGPNPVAAIADLDGDNEKELLVSVGGGTPRMYIFHVAVTGQKVLISASPLCEYAFIRASTSTSATAMAASGDRIALAGGEYFKLMKSPLANGTCAKNEPQALDPRLPSYDFAPFDIAYTAAASIDPPGGDFSLSVAIQAADLNKDQQDDYVLYYANSGLILAGLSNGTRIVASENKLATELNAVSSPNGSAVLGSVLAADVATLTSQTAGKVPILFTLSGPSLAVRPLVASDPYLSPQSFKRSLTKDPMSKVSSSSLKPFDIDGDGKLDVAAAIISESASTPNQYESAVKIFWSLRLGNDFEDERVTPLIDNGRLLSGIKDGDGRIDIGDLDRDGAMDLVVASPNRKKLSIYFGNPTQKRDFGPPRELALSPAETGARLAVGDVDGDGYADVVVSNNNDGLSVLCGNKERALNLLNAGLGRSLADVVLADLDGDSAHDLDVALRTNPNEVILLFNPGEPQSSRPCSDINTWMQDAKNQVWLSIGAKDGSVRELSQLLVADMNGDGLPELLVGQRTGALTVFQGDSTRTFTSRLLLQHSAFNDQRLVALDQNQDGLPDLYAVRTEGISFLRNTSR